MESVLAGSVSLASSGPGSLGQTALRPSLSRSSSWTARQSVRPGTRVARAQAETPPAKVSTTTSPFAGKKISTLLAARRQQAKDEAPPTPAQEPAAPAQAPPSPLAAPAAPVSPAIATLIKEASAAKPASSAGAASAAPTPASPFVARAASVNAVPSKATKPVVSFGKKSAIDALKADGGLTKKGAADMGTAKMGSPAAPATIFQDPVRTKEQIEAEKFRFEVSRGQFLLVLSFFASSILMMGTVYLVWKLGAIHFNEY